jgi:glycerophosphoryl diester phosphodiesterase
VNISSFPGPDQGSRVAQAAKSIKANVLSPNAGANLTAMFTTKEMIQEAHNLGLTVAPWTVSGIGFVSLR